MTAVTSPLAALLVPAAAPGARRGAGDSSAAFGRSLAAASDETANLGGSSGGDAASPEAPGVVGTLPDGAAHLGRHGLAGVVADGASLGALLEGVVPGEGETGAGADGVDEADGTHGTHGTHGIDGAGEGSGADGAVVLDGQQVAVLPADPSLVPPGSAPLPDAGLPGTAGPAGAPGTATGAVGLSAAGPEEQATVPVPPAGSAGQPGAEPQGPTEQATAQSTSLRGTSAAPSTPGAGTSVAPAPGVGSVPAAIAGQAQRGGAGASSGGPEQHSGGPVTTVPVAAGDPEREVSATTLPGADAAPAAAPGPAAPAQVVPAPVPVVQAPVSAAVGQVVPAGSSPQPVPTLHAQVSGPVFSLVGAGDGDHVLTLSVTPDNLGPVTVRAHISGGELRIELFAPHDAGREALRALAAELRRDLAGIAPSASLSVSDAKEAPAQGGPGSGGPGSGGHGSTGTGGPSDGRADGTAGGPGHDRWQDRPGAPSGRSGAATDQTIQPTVDDRTPGATRRLDVLV